MAGGSELEPKDSRNVTGTAHTPDGRWSGDAPAPGHGGELEPADSRNVTGTASTPDGRWTNDANQDPGASAAPKPGSPVEDDQGIPQTGEEDPLAEVSTETDYSRSVADFSQSEDAKALVPSSLAATTTASSPRAYLARPRTSRLRARPDRDRVAEPFATT